MSEVHIQIHLLDNYNYRPRFPSFPVIIGLYSGTDVEIYEPIQLNRVLMESKEDSSRVFGFVRNIFSKIGEPILLSSTKPLFVLGEVFDNDHQCPGFVSGEYDISVHMTTLLPAKYIG